jgi:hypothetical protein
MKIEKYTLSTYYMAGREVLHPVYTARFTVSGRTWHFAGFRSLKDVFDGLLDLIIDEIVLRSKS